MELPPLLQLKYDPQPTLAYSLHAEFNNEDANILTEHSNFLKGVKWSPDGIALATAADDNWLRIYDTPLELCQASDDKSNNNSSPVPNIDTLEPTVRIHAGELIYDYSWFSQATASDPSSWCIATTARAHPVHVWDALTGELRCSYRSYNTVDEPTAAYSIAFDPLGVKLYTGHNAAIHIFNIERPGRDYTTLKTHSKKQDGLPGIISCIAFAGDGSDLMAAGSYSGTAALYDPRTHELLYVLEGHKGGITHLKFSADGNYLYTGARQDGALYCWDARFASDVVYTINRPTLTTNQRIYFDIEPYGRHLATGGQDGKVHIHDLRDGREVASFIGAKDTVNGVAYHPYVGVLATASGERRFFLAPDNDGSDSSSEHEMEIPSISNEGKKENEGGESGGGLISTDENVLRLWQLQAELLNLAREHDVIAMEGSVGT